MPKDPDSLKKIQAEIKRLQNKALFWTQSDNISSDDEMPSASTSQPGGTSGPTRRKHQPPTEPRVTRQQNSDPDQRVQPPVEIADDPCTILNEAFGNIDRSNIYGPNVHPGLIQIESILLDGFTDSNRQKIMSKYEIPGNLTLLKAPIINEELLDKNRTNVDARIQKQQDQLGVGMAAIGKALTELLNANVQQTHTAQIKTIKTLVDGCQILADLHYSMTENRTHLQRKEATKNEDRVLAAALSNTKRDKTLFGSNLAEKIAEWRRRYADAPAPRSAAHTRLGGPLTPVSTRKRSVPYDSWVATRPHMSPSRDQPSTSGYKRRPL